MRRPQRKARTSAHRLLDLLRARAGRRARARARTGIGVCGAVTISIGALSEENALLATSAAMSVARPQRGGALIDDHQPAGQLDTSRGSPPRRAGWWCEDRSRRSQCLPSQEDCRLPSRRSSPSGRSATIVTSSPSRTCRALPNGTQMFAVGHFALDRRTAPCARRTAPGRRRGSPWSAGPWHRPASSASRP